MHDPAQPRRRQHGPAGRLDRIEGLGDAGESRQENGALNRGRGHEPCDDALADVDHGAPLTAQGGSTDGGRRGFP
jgi:hypothetical protein